MKEVLDYLANAGGKPFGAVVHIGAGACSELGAYRKMGPRELVLAEAHPAVAAELRSRIRPDAGERVVAAAIAAAEGDGSLVVMNSLRDSSLLKPEGLLMFFPNVRQTGEIAVQRMSLQQLLQSVDADMQLSNLLVLEIAGLEKLVLAGTDEAVLRRFSHIAVRTSDVPVYDSGADQAQVKECMAGLGFKLAYSPDESIYPFKDLLFEIDAAKADALQSRQHIDALAGQLRDRERYIDQLTLERDELRARLAGSEARAALFSTEAADMGRRLSALQVQIQQMGQADEQANAYSRQLQQQLDASTAAADAWMKRVADCESALKEAQRQKDSQQADWRACFDEAAARESRCAARIAELAAELETTRARYRRVDLEMDKVEVQLEWIKDIFINESRA
jgi:FkbM family methyltransferase